MNDGYKKYRPFDAVDLPDRQWPSKRIEKAPIWCSVDLRDGNQALVVPMNLEQKLLFFKTLIDVGFKEIEIGFPSASQTEFEILRTLIEDNYIPDDVTIQVLVQAREHLIRKTFEAIDGAKNVIVHFYNSTSTLQRKVVFQKDMDGIIDIAVKGAELIRDLTAQAKSSGTNIRFEYSPESFSGTEPENAVRICDAVMDTLGASPENKVILNLPHTVEGCTPNNYADQVEYFCRNIKNRDSAIISVHPHNDRGTGIASAELAIMAGADRVEGTLFGNGERTGNVDIVALAMNMYTQGVNPELDFSNINKIKEVYEKCTHMKIGERHPYVGELVFTAFSGSHQDAINKGVAYMNEHDSGYWEIPYLPIDPADVGRQYEPVIRINSQSGKGGAAFIMQDTYGYHVPKAMHPEFGELVKAKCDELGTELNSRDIFTIFDDEYINIHAPYRLKKHKIEESGSNGDSVVIFDGSVEVNGDEIKIKGSGNGPIDAFFDAIKTINITSFDFISYHEHAIGNGSDARAVAYIELKEKNSGRSIYGVGISGNINVASIKGVVSAINRAIRNK